MLMTNFFLKIEMLSTEDLTEPVWTTENCVMLQLKMMRFFNSLGRRLLLFGRLRFTKAYSTTMASRNRT